MELELETLSCTGSEGSLIGSGIVGELDDLVGAWELDERGEGSNELETGILDTAAIHVFVDLAVE